MWYNASSIFTDLMVIFHELLVLLHQSKLENVGLSPKKVKFSENSHFILRLLFCSFILIPLDSKIYLKYWKSICRVLHFFFFLNGRLEYIFAISAENDSKWCEFSVAQKKKKKWLETILKVWSCWKWKHYEEDYVMF